MDTGIIDVYGKDKAGKRVRKQLEVDFVVNQGNQRYYIQAAYDMTLKEKQVQEFQSLRSIPDSCKKIVIVNTTAKPWRYENTAYFNFDENEEYKQFFETTKDVDRILQNLMLASGQKIVPEKTLIIFDEVQDCPKVINSMKYFCENAPQYHIACAGSLLGIALAKPSSFPVGKVNFMQIDPMTFMEFLLANGDENLAKYLESVDTIEPIPDAFFNPLYEKLKMYYVTGGMPEPVLMWTQARDVSAMQEALSGIIGAYERDFAKHPNISEFPKISMVFKSIPSQLARENKKFVYKVVKEGREPGNMRMLCSGWWMPGWCIKSTAAPLLACR